MANSLIEKSCLAFWLGGWGVKRQSIWIVGAFLFLSLGAFARSDLDTRVVPLVEVRGLKFPNSLGEGSEPVIDYARSARPGDLEGFNKLLPYILRSPDQDEAGSCLYMANTGIAEWWLAKLNPDVSKASEGPIDLSERYLMNVAGIDEDKSPVKNWKTDTILLFNDYGKKSVLNSSYRFTKGWYVNDGKELKPSHKGGPGAEYGTSYNWINELGTIHGGYVNLPLFSRTVLFADPESNQWNVGVAPATVVSDVKEALIQNEAPVQVIYNHFGYWHAVMIVGFNDEMDSDGCDFVERSREDFPEQLASYQKQLNTTTDPKKKESLLARIAKTKRTIRDLEAAYEKGGGCSGKGVFYVRDSIYAEESGELYDYDKGTQGEESHYSKAVILHEYEWLSYLSNHVTQVFAEK